MDTELLAALGAEVAEQMQALRLEIRRDAAADLAAAQRALVDDLAALRERLVDSEHRRELVQRDLAALREAVGAGPVLAFSRDADGAVSLLQRYGPPCPLPLPDVAEAVRVAVAALGEALRAETHADVARTFELFCNAPAWSATAVYTAGDMVQTDIGRTFRVRAGVRAALGRSPGEDAEHWERVGTGGFRVLKARPEALEPGDWFTEHDARFLHDGAQTILFVPKAPKFSDLERAAKGSHGLAQATQAELREWVARMAAMLESAQRSTSAANDASEIGAQALAQAEGVRRDLEALERRVAALAGGAP